MDLWSIKKSSELYGTDSWGGGYFRINEKGHVEVTPHGNATATGTAGPVATQGIDLKELVDDLKERGLSLPLLVRFSDIVNSRIRTLSTAFHTAFQSHSYKGQYRGVYPIKVNQQRFLVEEIAKYGREFSLGLEAGSKPELLVALAILDNPEAVIVCNGFKDREFIETALLAQKLGRNCLVVIDRFSEIETIIQASKSLGIRPRIGFRAKLETRGAGKWVESSGAKSKFGLTASEMVKGVERLEGEGMLGCVELLHFHIGSQITTLRAIKDSLVEATRVYAELATMGAGLKYFDVGGGLGVDYDGSQTNWENSMNYSVQEYANHVVAQIASVCDDRGIPHPHIITEAGRALVAHHSVLVFDVVGTNCIKTSEIPERIENEEQETIVEMYGVYKALTQKNLNESIQDMYRLREDGMTLFNLGYMTLRQRGTLEQIFWAFCTRAIQVASTLTREPEEIVNLRKMLSDSYFCNFSVFQSAPDTWAVDQIFPLMPIHRLKEEPTRRGILLDLTCDSDGKIDRFIDVKDVKDALELHPLREGEDYYMGMFLVGAYQEILGDFHNLFGDTDAVHVSLSPSGAYSIDHVVEGDTVQEVLGYVQYDKPTLVRQVRNAIETALASKTITLEEARLLMRYYEDGLNGYTYLDGPADDSSVTAVDALRRLGQRQAGLTSTNGQTVQLTLVGSGTNQIPNI